jgi:hypothetical protein
MVRDVLHDLHNRPVNGCPAEVSNNPGQLSLGLIRSDAVAWPILEKAVALEAATGVLDPSLIEIRYLRKFAFPDGSSAKP